MTTKFKTKPFFRTLLLKSLIASLLVSSALAASTVALADSCSCSDDSSTPTVSIEESNEAHPNEFTLTANSAYYQLKDKNGRLLQDRLYDVTPFADGRVLAKRDGKYGLIGAQGELIFAFDYDAIEILPTELYLLSKRQGSEYSSALIRRTTNNAQEWLYPTSGRFENQMSIEALYYDATHTIGYYKTSSHNKFGLITDKKQTLIANQYDEIDLLDTCPNERLFMSVKAGDKTGLIDQNQNFIVPMASNQSIENFNEDEQIFKVSKYANEAYSTEPTIISEKLIKGNGQILIESDSPIQSVVNNLYQYSNHKKYGLTNSKADIIVPATFDYISSDSYSAPIVTKNEKQGILKKDDKTQQLVVNKYYDQLQEAYTDDKTLEQLRLSDSEEELETVYEEEAQSAYTEEDSYAKSASETEESVSDAAEEIIVDTPYTEDDNYDFQDTFFIAKSNNKYGLIDSNDQIRIPFLYDDIKLSRDILLVKKEQKYGLLTTHNETVAGVLYDQIDSLYNLTDDPIYRIIEGGKQGIISNTGEIIYPLSPYQIIDDSENGISRFVIEGANGKYGLLNDNASSILIPADYEKIERELSDKTIIAQINGKRVLIDKSGQLRPVDISQYTEIYPLDDTDNLLVTNNKGKQGVISSEGKVIIAPTYDSVSLIPFGYYTDDSKIYYMIELDGYSGLLDETGKSIVKPNYVSMAPLYYSSYVKVSEPKSDPENVKVGLLDSKGSVVKALKYDSIFEDYYNDDEQISLIMISDDTVEIYDNKLRLIEKMSVEKYEQRN